MQVQQALCYALTANIVELIPALGALFPRGGPVQDPVLTGLTGGSGASRSQVSVPASMGTGGGGVGTKWSAPLERATQLVLISFSSPLVLRWA